MRTLICGLMVQVLLLVLKLTNTINWNWFVVMAPYEAIIALYIIGALSSWKKEKNDTDEHRKAQAEWRKLKKNQ